MDYLEMVTNLNSGWWVTCIETLIRKHETKNPDDPDHPDCDVRGWVTDLMEEVFKVRKTYGRYDGNLNLAHILGFVLLSWYIRVHRSKIFDSNRVTDQRLESYDGLMRFERALFELMVDVKDDFMFFPFQRWGSPFDPSDEPGDFK